MDSLAEARIKGSVIVDGVKWFAVASRSKPGTWHLSNKDQCTCIGHTNHGHCYHQGLCQCVRCLGKGFVAGDPDEGCYFCEGTGDA